jgi:hypothetical protein
MSIEEADTEVAADTDTVAGEVAVDIEPAAGTRAEPDIEAEVGTEAGPDIEAEAGTEAGPGTELAPAVAEAGTEAGPDTESVPAAVVAAADTELEPDVELAPALAVVSQAVEAVPMDTHLPLSADRGKRVSQEPLREEVQVPARILAPETAAHRIRRAPRYPAAAVNNWLAVSQL